MRPPPGRIALVVTSLLTVAMLILWVRSYWRSDIVDLTRSHWAISIDSACGHVLLSHKRVTAPGWDLGNSLSYYTGESPEDRDFYWPESLHAGFGVEKEKIEEGATRSLLLPYWFLTLSLAVFPVLYATRWIASLSRQRLPSSARKRCGYDLRASPNRCPECGAIPNSAIRSQI